MKESDNDQDKLLIDFQDEETKNLLSDSEKKEKDHLIRILKRLEKDLEKNDEESINDVYIEYLNNEDITKRNIKKNTNFCLLYFMFYIVSPSFTIINLIGIFQIISIMKVLLSLLKDLTILYFKNENNNNNDQDTLNYNFFDLFYKNALTEPFDFKLTMIFDFLGVIVLKSRGFRISSVIFMIINLISLFLLINYDFYKFDPSSLSIFQILYLLFCFILLFVGVGASSLLSLQILIDSNSKYKNFIYGVDENEIKNYEKLDNELNSDSQNIKIEEHQSANIIDKTNSINILKDEDIKDNKSAFEIKKEKIREKNIEKRKETLKRNRENKFDFFFIICITTIMGYFGKYLINFIIIDVKNNYDNDIQNSTVSYNYFYKDLTLNDTSSLIFTHDKYLFYYIIGIYSLCIILSIILYSIFVCIFTENKKNNKGDKYRISQICGYTIYSEKIVLNDKIPKCECIKLFCKTFKNFCNESVCNMFSFSEEDKNKDKCCCCCSEYDEKEYEKNREFFCYCYQAKRKQYWFNKFITNESHSKIFPYMLEYFILKFTTIAFESQYNVNVWQTDNEKKDFKKSIKNYFNYIFYFNSNNDYIKYNYKETLIFLVVFIATFLLFFYFTLSFSRFFKTFRNKYKKENIEDKNDENKMKKHKEMIIKISKISSEILDGLHGILFFNGIFSFIFSLLYLLNYKDNYILIENIFQKTNNYIYIPILMNKFFCFTLIYYCLIFKLVKGFDLISSASLISIYIVLYDLAISIIQNIFDDENIYILYIIQLIFSSIPTLLFVVFIIFETVKSFVYKTKIKDILFILSFILLGGGLWFKKDVNETSYCSTSCVCCKCCCCYCIGKACYCDCCCCDSDSCCYCCCFKEESCCYCNCCQCFYCCDCCECCESCC